MSAITFQYGTWSPTITPKIVISRSAPTDGMQSDGFYQTPVYYDETWTVEGEFIGDQDSLIAQLATAKTALGTNHQTLYLKNAAGNIRSFAASDTVAGIIVDTFALPEIDGVAFAASLKWAAVFKFRVTADGSSPNACASQYTLQVENSDGNTRIEIQGSVQGPQGQFQTKYQEFKTTIKPVLDLAYTGVKLVAEVTTISSAENSIKFSLRYQSKTPLVFGWRQTIELSPPAYLTLPMEIVPGVGTTPDQDSAIMQTGGKTACYCSDSGTCMGVSGYPTFPPSRFGSVNMIASPRLVKHAPSKGVNGELVGFPIEWRYEHAFPTVPVMVGVPVGNPLDPYFGHPTSLIEREIDG